MSAIVAGMILNHAWRASLRVRNVACARAFHVSVSRHAAQPGTAALENALQRTRNIGIIAHIDAVRLSMALVFAFLLIVNRVKQPLLSACSTTVVLPGDWEVGYFFFPYNHPTFPFVCCLSLISSYPTIFHPFVSVWCQPTHSASRCRRGFDCHRFPTS